MTYREMSYKIRDIRRRKLWKKLWFALRFVTYCEINYKIRDIKRRELWKKLWFALRFVTYRRMNYKIRDVRRRTLWIKLWFIINFLTFRHASKMCKDHWSCRIVRQRFKRFNDIYVNWLMRCSIVLERYVWLVMTIDSSLSKMILH